MATTNSDRRHQPCYLLRDHGIPCVVWFEDAIGYYGVPTVVFDLYVLVSDIEAAAQVLTQNGWTLVPQEKGKIGNANVKCAQRRLAPPYEDVQEAELSVSYPHISMPPPPSEDSHEAELSDHRPHTYIPPPPSTKPPGPTTTVLLPAADWNFNLEGYSPEHTETLITAVIPPLAGLVDALIDSLLDCSSNNGMLRDHLAVQIAYLYSWAPALQERAFADHLMYEHRQYHFDVLSGMSHVTVPFISHQGKVREALRKGTHELRDCSARDNKDLFSGEWEARVLASMPNPFPEEQEDGKVEDGWEIYDHAEENESMASGYTKPGGLRGINRQGF
ncbi:hypothetical protein BU16DRAFT_588751 [Lophium mytilinum]|uniref:Uncharacterized protein n=1 Tax=Lophium mytilinum TaxID=390894 RepID=A0A6A6RFC6_9PEZI|nr:hypothetical protein BU16DRAFT_588751 [Lophium mytilinum]